MMPASSANAASPLSGEYQRAFEGIALPGRALLQTAPAMASADVVTGLARQRQQEMESPVGATPVVADGRQEVVT